MIISKKTGIKMVTLLIIFTVSFALYCVCCNKTGTYYSSDSVYPIISGKDIMSGNILLNNWYGCRYNMYSISLLYGILGRIFGYSWKLIWVVPAFLWASLLTLVSWIVLYFDSEKRHSYVTSVAKICLVFVLCYSSCYFTQGDKILPGIHFDVALVGVLYMWVISREIEACRNYTLALIVVSCLLVLHLLSDSLTQLYIVIPVVVGLLFNLLFLPTERTRKKYLAKHLVLCAGLFAVSKAILVFLQGSGQAIYAHTVSGVDVPEWTELFPSIAYWIKTSIYLFGCDIFGQHIGADSGILILRFLTLCLVLLGIGLSFKKLSGDIFNHFLIFCVATVSLIIIFTQEVANERESDWTSRLMYSFYFSIVLLAVQIDWNRVVSLIKLRINKKIYLGVGFAAMALMMVFNMSVLRIEGNSLSEIRNGYARIADVLAEKGLTKGYGTYWLSSAVTVASGYRVEVRPVGGQDLSVEYWMTDTDGWDYADFILVDDSMWAGVSEESIIDSIGFPEERIQVDETTILIWDENIMPYISGSGYTGEMLNNWWRLEDGQNEKVIETTDRHFYSDFEAGENRLFTSAGEGYLVFGPYREMGEGVYDITFQYEYAGGLGEGVVLGIADAYSAQGNAEEESAEAVSGENSVTVKNVRVLPECTDFEIRFYAYVDGITMQRIVIQRSGG